jgi:hypothetical protein
MKFIKKTVCLIIPIILSYNISIAQKNKDKVKISLDTVRVEGRVGVLVNFNNMPKERFVLEIPEIFMLQKFKEGLSNYSKQQWKFTKEGGNMELTDGNYHYSIKLIKKIFRNTEGLAWKISVTNNSDSSLYDLASFNCWTMNTSPLFKDTKMERTFVNDISGNKIFLKDVEKTQGGGRRNMQFYPSKNGIDLSKSAWLNQWLVSSPQTLSGNKIAVSAKDGTYLFENIVNGVVAFYFNNWEHDHGCVHASPLIARELKPGKTATANGIFKFSKLKSN